MILTSPTVAEQAGWSLICPENRFSHDENLPPKVQIYEPAQLESSLQIEILDVTNWNIEI